MSLVTEKKPSAMSLFNSHLSKMKEQMGLVLPRHMTPDRMARLALTAFSREPKLQKCSFESIAAGVLIASQMGLEIGVGGQGWLIPYGEEATFVPGWQGLLELLNRSGRATAWTGAVREGDSFDWELGDSPYLKHKPVGGKAGKPIFTYAIGRIKGMDWPVIEVWDAKSIEQHRERYNKVGGKHYSFANDNNWEMYARKVPLLQVLKYLPKSIELEAAIAASYAADSGETYTVDADFTVVPKAEPKPPEVEVDADRLAAELAEKQANQRKKKQQETEEQSAESGPGPGPGNHANAVESEPEHSSDEPDIVGDYKTQIAECESDVDLKLIESSIRRSKALNNDEKVLLARHLKTRQEALSRGQ